MFSPQNRRVTSKGALNSCLHGKALHVADYEPIRANPYVEKKNLNYLKSIILNRKMSLL